MAYEEYPHTEPVETQEFQLRKKSHVVCGLLALFLGAFGVHKFYLGYTVVGFLTMAVTIVGSLLTFGIAALVVGLISVMEAINYFLLSQSTFEKIYLENKREWF